MTAATVVPRLACRVSVRGVVQGVGFRPFVHRLALRHRLDGWVRNASGEVALGLEGEGSELEAFLAELRAEAPPLAAIESVAVAWTAPEGLQGFRIESSAEVPGARLPVPPDVALCPACEAELLDPMNRRYRYPFITCTDCGPRYTVIERLPYDRERTTMRAFTQCPDCRREYDTPGNRRHHSETNSCPACGPSLWFEAGAEGQPAAWSEGALRDAAVLRCGRRDPGRARLRRVPPAADATSEVAVRALRVRKGREAKPLALMVRSVAATGARPGERGRSRAAGDDPSGRSCCSNPARRGPGARGGTEVDTIGVMLPATPLHLLLSDAVDRPLVMTSGSRTRSRSRSATSRRGAAWP